MVLLARCNHCVAKTDHYKEARDAQNLHEITDLLLDETPRDSRERLKPTQINRVVRAHRCRGVKPRPLAGCWSSRRRRSPRRDGSRRVAAESSTS